MTTFTRLPLLAAVIVIATATAVTSAAADNPSGFTTSVDPMLVAGIDRPDVAIQKIISVGDTLPGGYLFESIPDGISLVARGNGRADVFLNHETSTVPFPVPGPGQPAVEQTAQNDYDDSSLSQLSLNQHSKGVLHGWTRISGDENWQRFCSNYLATGREGFDRDILFLNEETPDTVNRSGVAFPLNAGGTNPDQAGYVVGYDIKSGEHKKIPGMGRLNHENSVPIPGFGKLVVLTGDDTFSTSVGSPQSQVYAYIAPDTDALWNDQGHLYGFASNDPAVQKYEDFNPITGLPASISGKFVKIDDAIARGGQAGLEAVPGIFRFIRIEDIAYDKRNPNIVYLADSGRATSGAAAPGKSTNGRIWKMVLSESADPDAPLNVTLSILLEGDDNPTKTFREIHQADNLETTANSLLVTEDPSTGNQFLAGDAGAHTARVWRVPLTSPGVAGTPEVVLSVDQSLDERAGYDVDGENVLPLPVTPIAPGRLGSWEASGIVDASSIWGPGWFLVDVQAHTLWVSKEPDPVNPGFTRKREGGQLLAVYIPNA
jgi:uncharacterized protein DUF839